MHECLKKYVAFGFYVLVLITLLSAASLTADYSIPAIIVLFSGGLLSWTFLEYFVHRFAFHSDAKKKYVPEVLSAYHMHHHRNPKEIDDLFMDLPMSVPIAAAYYGLAWLVLGSWQATAYLFCGLISGYFVYEYVHYQTHHGACKSRPMKYMKRYHLGHHHRSPDSCYGLTSPLIDILFGTFKPTKQRNLHPAPITPTLADEGDFT